MVSNIHSEYKEKSSNVSLAEIAIAESRKSVAKILSISTVIIIPIFIFFKMALYLKEVEQIQKGIWSSISYSLSINDVFQIDRTLYKLHKEFSLSNLVMYEVTESGKILKSWESDFNNHSNIKSLNDINLENDKKVKSTIVKNNWSWDFSNISPAITLKKYYELGSNRKIISIITKQLPVASFLIELFILLFIITSGQIFLVYFFLQSAKKLIKPIETLTRLLHYADSDALNELPKIKEVQELFLRIRDHETLVKDIVKRDQEQEQTKALMNLSRQVAHDIRSPMAVLGLIINKLKMPLDDRRMLESVFVNIKEILDDLTSQALSKKNKRVDLCELVGEAVSEKQQEYSNNSIIEITYSATAYPLFLEIDSVGLKRCISNIINNSVEATESEKNIINVVLRTNEKFAEITISDIGKGLPNDNFKEIVDKGFSFDKPGGSGLGIKSCKEYLSKYSGTIEYHSNKPKGLTATIRIPFEVNLIAGGAIYVAPSTEVIVIDDESMAPDFWKDKFKEITKKITVFKNYHGISNLDPKNHYLILCDFDLGIGQLNGLEIRQRLSKTKLKYDFILVSGASIDNFSSEVGLNFIPKSEIQKITVAELM